MANLKKRSKMNTRKNIADLTIDEVSWAAQENAAKYDTMFKKTARAAFIEGVMWAQKVQREGKL